MSNKTASIFRASFSNDALNFTDLKISSPEFTEKRSDIGGMIDVEFKARVTDVTSDITSSCDKEGVIRLDYTNGDSFLVGSLRSPVILTLEKSGVPVAYYLHYKGQQPYFSQKI